MNLDYIGHNLTTLYVAIVVLLQLADAITTYKALTMPGTKEANGIMRSIFDKVGVLPGLLLVKGPLIALVVIFATYIHPGIFFAMSALYCVVVFNNIKIIRKLSARQVQGE